MKRIQLFRGVSLLAAASCWAQPVVAQAVGPDGVGQLEEIMVTAQRDKQNLQKVPIAISAVTANMASAMGIRDSQDIAIAAPAVNYQPTPSGANITIRGIGGSGASVDEAANAIYIDGVYQASTPGLMFSLNNIERIEVAKGPQGTLFGRNSTGGVIQIVTKQPKNDFAADASLGYGNYNTREEQLYVTGGFGRDVAADLAIYDQRQLDGWGRNVNGGGQAYAGRSFAAHSKLRWDIDDDTSVTLSGMYSDITPQAGQGGSVLPGETTRGGSGVAGTAYSGFYNINYDGQYREQTRQFQFAATLKHDFGWARLVNIASVGRTDLTLLQDRDFGPAPSVQVTIDNPVVTRSEELQLLAPTDAKIKWVAGFYYFDNSIRLDPVHYTGPGVGAGFPTQFVYSRADTHSYSLYAQATTAILDRTNLTLGLRETIDDRTLDATTTIYTGAISAVTGSVQNKKLTYRAALDHQLTDDVLLYASVSTGFHSGLYNIASPTQPPVDPESVRAYEAGIKTELFDRSVRLNLSGFTYTFDNIQVKTLNSLGAAVLLNAANARIKGIDLDFAATPTANLTLQGGLSYLDSTYETFLNVPYFTPSAAGGLTQFTGNASGNRTVFSPRWVATFAVQYRLPTSIGPLTWSATENYNSGFFFDPQNRLGSGAYNLVNTSLAWESHSGNVELRLWARNLFDQRHYGFVASSTLGDEYYPAAPRTFGATLRLRYN
jgi:iron complex outermembrane recepter protein